MKKLLLLLLFIPLVLFSQPIPISDSIRIYSLDPNGVSLAEHEPKIWYYEYILDESYNYNESRENFSGTRENLLLGRIEKNFDANGTLREELFQAATYNLMGQSYLRLFNKWGKLKVEILLNKNGFKDGIETFWRNEYNDYKPDPPLWKKTEITYSNGNFVSSKTFAYKSDAVDYEVILLNEQTESILTVDLRFYLSKRYTNGNRGEYTHSRIYKNGVYTGLNGQGGKAGKDREWWANGNLQKEVNYQTIEKTKTSFKEGLKNNPTFYLNSQTNGFTREWYEGGELLSETYFEDDSFKSFKSFYASGNLKKEKNNFNSDDGKNENIVEKKYFANGNLKYSYSFVKIFDSAFIPYSGKIGVI
jgi:antitoxin component YwqK of YwqJK toxin-antitoxin module